MSESLEATIGTENLAKVAVAYERAVSILSFNDCQFAPSRPARIQMIRAMLADGPSHGFDADRLTLAALPASR